MYCDYIDSLIRSTAIIVRIVVSAYILRRLSHTICVSRLINIFTHNDVFWWLHERNDIQYVPITRNPDQVWGAGQTQFEVNLLLCGAVFIL